MMRPFDYPIAAIIVLLVIWYVYRHVKRAWFDPGGEKAGVRPSRSHSCRVLGGIPARTHIGLLIRCRGAGAPGREE